MRTILDTFFSCYKWYRKLYKKEIWGFTDEDVKGFRHLQPPYWFSLTKYLDKQNKKGVLNASLKLIHIEYYDNRNLRKWFL